MSVKSALKVLFLHVFFHAVVAKLRTNEKNQQRLLLTGSPALDVAIADISVKYNNAKGYDINGCLDPSKAPQSKYYAQVQYEIRNSGDAGFVAPSESVNYAACGTPAILKFLTLKIEGGRDVSGNPYPAIELSRFATCVIDDSNTTDAGSCKAGGPTTVFTQKPSQSYGINQGGSYGVSKVVYVKFPLTADQFNALSNSAPSTLTFTLSVNKAISPNGAAGVVAAVDGSKLKEVAWQATGQGTSVLLFIRPPSAAPTTAPTAAPTAAPSTTPTVEPTTAPSAPPTTTPSTVPTTAPSIAPTVVSSASPTASPIATPSNAPSAVPSTAVAASSMICDNIIGPNPGTTTVSGYGNDQTLKRVCLTTAVQSIGDSAFMSRTPTFTTSSISSIYIPSTVKTIGTEAFLRNKLQNVTFAGDIVSIGEHAFYLQYISGQSVVFPGAVGSIGFTAFAYSKIVSLSFGGPVGYIGQNAFFTNRIQSVTFPAGLTYLGQTAFDSNQLTSVTFRGQVTVFGNDVFQNNPNLKTVYYPQSWTNFPKTTKFPNGGAGITFVEVA